MTTTLRNYVSIFLKAILAGLCIGIGGIVYLSCTSKIAGAILFAIGLLTILLFKLKLFTGACGYFIESTKKLDYFLELVIIWIGNFLGTFIIAKAITFTRLTFNLDFVSVKIEDTLISLFILGIGCGFLMYVGVDTFNHTTIGPLMPVMCVAVFILAGFEHCIADMFYFSLYGISTDILIRLLIITSGNIIGSWIIPIVSRILLIGSPHNAKRKKNKM